MIPYILYILFAIFVAFILLLVRYLVPKLTDLDRSTIGLCVGWCIIAYSIILGFSIANFYSRYLDFRDTFITEATNLKLMYRYFKQLPQSEDTESIINNIKEYSEHILKISKTDKYPLDTSTLYRKMDKDIIKYLNSNSTIFNNNILSRLSTDERVKKLFDEIKAGHYYIMLLGVLIIFIIIPLSLSKMDNIIIQFVVDSSILIILFSVIHLLMILNDPFGINNPIGLNLSMYSDLIKEIDGDTQLNGSSLNESLNEPLNEPLNKSSNDYKLD